MRLLDIEIRNPFLKNFTNCFIDHKNYFIMVLSIIERLFSSFSPLFFGLMSVKLRRALCFLY